VAGSGAPLLVVVGTGRLARATCYSLAVTHPEPLRVVVVGRREGAAAEACQVASTRAAVTGRGGVRFEPAVAEDAAALAGTLGGLSPSGVLVCASSQSPWERLDAPSAWTTLVERAGFGLTLPFQAELALAAAAALDGAWLVNACFPDAVNPLLAALGVPVLCGVGNVGLLEASLRTALGVDPERLHVLGHHVHLHHPDLWTSREWQCLPEHTSPLTGEALAWCEGEPIPELTKLLTSQRSIARTELNHITGLTAALVVSALLTGAELATSLPGPNGLPGGYPVLVRGGRVELRLPPGLTQAQAVAHNQRWALVDGVVVDGQRVRFSASAELPPELADGFDVNDLDAVTQRLHELRERLRGEPPR
jgi:hypothetical protein